MSIEIIAFVFGCVLVLIGIIGGGMEIKGLKIPTIHWPTRIIAIVGDIVFRAQKGVKSLQVVRECYQQIKRKGKENCV